MKTENKVIRGRLCLYKVEIQAVENLKKISDMNIWVTFKVGMSNNKFLPICQYCPNVITYSDINQYWYRFGIIYLFTCANPDY